MGGRVSSLAGVRTLDRLSPEALRHTVITFRDTMKVHAPGINRLNVYPVPDGDTGTNMARTLDAVVAELEKADEGAEPTCNAISHGSLMGARGNSGVILSQILRGMAHTLKDTTEATAAKVAEALKAASHAAYQAVLKPIEGTILTVVRESADAAHGAAPTTTTSPSLNTTSGGEEVLDLGTFASGAELREALAEVFPGAAFSADDGATRSRASDDAVARCAEQLRVTLELADGPQRVGIAVVDGQDVLVYEFATVATDDGSPTTLVAAVGIDACDPIELFER